MNMRACDHRVSLLVRDWPDADRRAWEDACRPGCRLKAGGAASALAQASRNDFATGYGAFLAFLQRTGRLERHQPAADQVTLPNVEAYIADLSGRVGSVTVHTYVHHMRRAAQLLAPTADFSWLAEIEKDLALVAEPRSKLDQLVHSGQLVKAGLTLIAEAQEFANNDLARARGVRNGLMIALLALCPIRLKNFAALEIGHTFKQVHGRWWILLPSESTKTRRRDERCVPELLNPAIEVYLTQSRPVLLGSNSTNALWISSNTGGPMTKNNLSTLISRVTLKP
jgi:site-specific recombinase XerD